MNSNPFVADPARRMRHEALLGRIGSQVRAEIAARMHIGPVAIPGNAGNTLSAVDVGAILAKFGLGDVRDLMLLAAGTGEQLARPSISRFFVGAVGLEAETGDLVFGGNLEFPGTHLGTTVHAEGFVLTRAFSRRRRIEAIALKEAHPCAHCRQYLSEFSAGGALELIDPLGHRLKLSELYPWPFDPGYLGSNGALPGAEPFGGLRLGRDDIPPRTRALLLAAGARAHAPYSKCPGAMVLELEDGNAVSGFCIESVAFNPTMPPLQAALINLIAHGYPYSVIRRAILGTFVGGDVDYSESTAELLGHVAPKAEFTVCSWRMP